jgi:acyl-CoA reductase-like NAD-dependent aldehyde dehydrogenase
MRNAIVRMPEHRSGPESRKVLRTAIRQLERAEIYLAAVASMELGDAPAESAVEDLRGDVKHLISYLSDRRARIDV